MMMKKVKSCREFIKVYPDEKREYVMDYGRRYKGKYVNDIPSDYFDWVVKAVAEDDKMREMEKVFDKLSLEDCLFFANLVEANGK